MKKQAWEDRRDELNREYRGKTILISGDHPDAGKVCTFVTMILVTNKADVLMTFEMQVRDATGKKYQIKHSQCMIKQVIS